MQTHVNAYMHICTHIHGVRVYAEYMQTHVNAYMHIYTCMHMQTQNVRMGVWCVFVAKPLRNAKFHPGDATPFKRQRCYVPAPSMTPLKGEHRANIKRLFPRLINFSNRGFMLSHPAYPVEIQIAERPFSLGPTPGSYMQYRHPRRGTWAAHENQHCSPGRNRKK